MANLRENATQVQRRYTFTLLGHSAGNRDDAVLIVWVAAQQACSQRSVLLRHQRRPLVKRNERLRQSLSQLHGFFARVNRAVTTRRNNHRRHRARRRCIEKCGLPAHFEGTAPLLFRPLECFCDPTHIVPSPRQKLPRRLPSAAIP